MRQSNHLNIHPQTKYPWIDSAKIQGILLARNSMLLYSCSLPGCQALPKLHVLDEGWVKMKIPI